MAVVRNECIPDLGDLVTIVEKCEHPWRARGIHKRERQTREGRRRANVFGEVAHDICRHDPVGDRDNPCRESQDY